MDKTYKIDGQLWRTVKRTTLEHDFYLMRQLRACGLANCTPNKGETEQDYALRLLAGIIENGVTFEVLGGLLIPQGVPDEKWDAAQAESTAAIMRQITAPEDKAVIQKIIIALVTDFFSEGLRCSNALSTASATAIAQPSESETSAAQLAPNTSPILESGETLLESLRSTR